ncbi:MAG: hypothetical protein U1F61_18200 [Opitutaceae bacterium]
MMLTSIPGHSNPVSRLVTVAASLAVAVLGLPAAEPAPPFQKVIFTVLNTDSAEFEGFARQAASVRATHVTISDLPKSRWQWERDLNDPYPNWGMMVPTLFKVVVPPALKQYLPGDYAAKNLAIVKERAAVLQRLGIRAVFRGKEPAWLPSEVYDAHPEWRGPRVEHPRRARNAYYAPCIDQPEVLALYREAVRELCRQAPIDDFEFLTNDSGGGFCWSRSLYPGRNGPSWCESIPHALRIERFLSTIQAGARDSGCTVDASMFYGAGVIASEEVAAIVAGLSPRQWLNGRSSSGTAPTVRVGLHPFYNHMYPVFGIYLPEEMARRLQEAVADKAAAVELNFSRSDSPIEFALWREFLADPGGRGMVGRMALLRRTAVGFVGEAQADGLVDAWHELQRAIDTAQTISPDPILMVGAVNQRWITRPFVPFPAELEPAERDYFRRFQFQATSEEEANDLMNLQGFTPIKGYSGGLLASQSVNEVLNRLDRALRSLGQVAAATDRPAAATELRATEKRVRTLACLYRTARHAIQYQAILDQTDYEQPLVERTIYPLEGDQRLRDLQRITRAEVDNTQELIRLVETAGSTRILLLAPTEAEEDIFLLSPNLVPQLKKKIEIMLRHELDSHRLYERRQG